MSEFEDFAQAASKQTQVPPTLSRSYRRIAVLGGGADARLVAAYALSMGAEVTLFSAYGAELTQLRAGSGITLRGEGPIGSYQVDRQDGPSVRLTAELDTAISGADLIFLTGPIHKQRTYAMVLADHLADGQVLAVLRARSFAALETLWLLRTGGCRAAVTVLEINLPYWYRAEGSVLHLTRVLDNSAGALPSGDIGVFGAPHNGVLSFAGPVMRSTLESGFNDGSGLVEVPALVLGGALMTGGPKIPMGGVPLEENQSFATLIGPDHRAVIHDLAEERRNVAAAYGVRDVPETDALIGLFAGATKGPTARPIPDGAEAMAMLRDAVIGSLVPLLSAGRLAGIEASKTEAMVTLVSSLLGADLVQAGRRLEAMGITGRDLGEARRNLERAVGPVDG